MYEREIVNLLKKYHQHHLIEDVQSLSKEAKRILLQQLNDIIPNEINDKRFKKQKLQPLKQCEHLTEQDKQRGQEYLENKSIGIVITAAGQGTRLGFNKFKGMFPISLIRKKSLFQLICEKIAAAEKTYHTKAYIAIMVSVETIEEIREYFEKYNYFGLDKKRVQLFFQESVALWDEKKKWVWEKQGKIYQTPNGNGSLFASLEKQGVINFFDQHNVEDCFVISVDNPLADPIDPALLAVHRQQNNEITLVTIKKDEEIKQMGACALDNGQLRIIEYCEQLSEEMFFYYNVGTYVFSLAFIKEQSAQQLPYHIVKKMMHINGKEQTVIKREKFVFDSLYYCKKAQAVVKEREQCFAALKNKESIDNIKKALLVKDRKFFTLVTGQEVKGQIFELSMDFHYPSQYLFDKWKGKSLPDSSYIHVDLV